jgi:hypothetical protein
MTNANSDPEDAGQPLSAAGEGHTGTAEPDDACPDPTNPATKPQGTQQDQEKNMESEGQPVRLPADTGRLPDSTDREAKFTKDRAGS